MLNMFGDPGPLSFDKVLNRISTKAPDIFGMMYHAGQMYSATGVTSPVVSGQYPPGAEAALRLHLRA